MWDHGEDRAICSRLRILDTCMLSIMESCIQVLSVDLRFSSIVLFASAPTFQFLVVTFSTIWRSVRTDRSEVFPWSPTMVLLTTNLHGHHGSWSPLTTWCIMSIIVSLSIFALFLLEIAITSSLVNWLQGFFFVSGLQFGHSRFHENEKTEKTVVKLLVLSCTLCQNETMRERRYAGTVVQSTVVGYKSTAATIAQECTCVTALLPPHQFFSMGGVRTQNYRDWQ